MRKKLIWILVAVALLIAGGVTTAVLLCNGDTGNSDIMKGDTAPVTDGNWELTNEWTIERAESGEETLKVTAQEDSTAWNSFFKLYEEWTVSVDLALTEQHGDTDCMRLAFGDQFNNVCAVASAEYRNGQVLLKADVLNYNGWKTMYTADAWADYDPEQPITLCVKRVSGARKLTLSLSQGDTILAEGTTRTISDEVMDMIGRAAVSVYGTVGEFTNFSVQAARPKVDLSKNSDGIIEAGPNVPTEDWLLGEGAVHNILDGGSAIIIDGEGEKLAWNAVTELGDEWTMSCFVEFGKGYRDSVCARFMFGANAELPGNVAGLITVNYTNGQVNLEAQDKEGDSWITTANSMGWKNVSARHIRVVIAKYAGINRLAIFLYDEDRLVYSTFTDEMEAKQMEKYKHFGVMVFSSQVRFSQFELSDTADPSIMPSMAERVYPHVSNLTVPDGESTKNWALSKHTTFFHENGKEAMVIDSKGEEFSYYTAHSIDGAWSMSARVDFGTYYSDTAGVRVSFTTAEKDFAGLLTVKYSPDSGGTLNVNMQTYIPETDGWNDILKTGWQKGDTAFYLNLSGDASGKLTVQLVGANTGKTIMEETVTLDKDTLSRMKVIGLATLAAQSKYSEIEMNLTGGAVEMSGTSDPSNKTMYPLTYGAPAASSEWATESGIVYTSDGALVADTASNAYAYNLSNTIADGFTISTDILFGKMDSNGVCTARIALSDQFHSMIGLFSIKFSENFEVMVEGQYNDNGTWVNCITDNRWREVQDNRVHVILSRAAGSDTCTLGISDYSGKNVFYGSLTMPGRVARKIVAFGLGADKSSAKFTNMYCKLSGKQENTGTIEDYGMLPISEGTEAATSRWIMENGATYRSGDALLIEGKEVYARDGGVKFSNGFSITTDIQFGSLDKDGVCTARIALLDKSGSKVSILTFKFSQNFEVMVQGEYDSGSGWTNYVKDTSWRKVQDNRLHVVVEREDDSTALKLRAYDFAGNEVFSETCVLPYSVAAKIAGYELGVDNSTVKYSYIYTYASDTELPPQQMIPITETGSLTGGSSWTAGSGVKEYSDGSLILESSGADVFSYRSGLTISDAFTLTAKLHFGKLDSEGVSTARIVLTDTSRNMVGLFTVKFSDSFEVMAEGEYTSGGSWKTVLSGTGWQSVADNIVTVKLVRQSGSGSYILTVTDSSGATVLSAVSTAMPDEINQKITGIGLGARNTEVKFSNIDINTEAAEPDQPDIADGEESIVIGTVITPAGWTGGSGVIHTAEGCIVTSGSGDIYSYNTANALESAFTLRTDVVFGTKGGDGTCTARIALGDDEKHPVGLITLKYDGEKKLLIQGQYYFGGSWTTVLAADWREVGTNHLVVTLARAAGSNTLSLTVAKQDGTVVYGGTTAEIPADAFTAMTCYGLGSFSSQVQFSKISYSVS